MGLLSSRPEENLGIVLDELDSDELELIAALLWPVNLGPGSRYKRAAYNLMNRLETLYGQDFLHDSAVNVDMTVGILDAQTMTTERTVGQYYVEFNV